MAAIHRILYAVKEPDPRRDTGAAKAVALAKACGATLELFHAVSTPLFLPTEPPTGASLADLKRDTLELQTLRLHKLADAVKHRGVTIDCVASWDYPPHEAIVRRAHETGADLIVAPCHKGSRGKSWLVRLTDFELLRVSDVPVLLLKNTEPYRRPVIMAAVDPSHTHAKPLDLDTRILHEARHVSAALRGSLHVVHVNNPPLHGLSTETATYGEIEKQDIENYEKLMTGSGVPDQRRHLVSGSPAVAIPRIARKLGAGLVVMGAVSRSGLARVFIGNTAERVLGDLPCDVLVVKPAAFGKRVSARRRGALLLTHAPTSAHAG
jgi:universal stress protein E